jgi:hypothetical protein
MFLISALVGGQWSASRPCRFIPGERTPYTHLVRGWVGPRAGLDDVDNWNCWHYQDSNSDPSDLQPVASRYTGPMGSKGAFPEGKAAEEADHLPPTSA